MAANLDAPAPNPSPLRIRQEGITILSEGSQSPIIADVVFVHGLQGHPQKTWTYTKPVEKPKKSQFSLFSQKQEKNESPITKTSTFWPKDLLPTDIPNIRIFTYGYDSHISHFFGGPANKKNIFQHGGSLLEDLARARAGTERRPIIFVAHSLGGLIVKQALIESRKQIHHDDLLDVYRSTVTIVFFGTPHRGSPDAGWGEILTSIAKGLQFDTNAAILNDLSSSSGGSKLDELMKDFIDILNEAKIQICTFTEASGKAGVRILGSKVIEYVSELQSNRIDLA